MRKKFNLQSEEVLLYVRTSSTLYWSCCRRLLQHPVIGHGPRSSALSLGHSAVAHGGLRHLAAPYCSVFFFLILEERNSALHVPVFAHSWTCLLFAKETKNPGASSPSVRFVLSLLYSGPLEHRVPHLHHIGTRSLPKRQLLASHADASPLDRASVYYLSVLCLNAHGSRVGVRRARSRTQRQSRVSLVVNMITTFIHGYNNLLYTETKYNLQSQSMCIRQSAQLSRLESFTGTRNRERHLSSDLL